MSVLRKIRYAWYDDKENRRAIKREQCARNQHNRYE